MQVLYQIVKVTRKLMVLNPFQLPPIILLIVVFARMAIREKMPLKMLILLPVCKEMMPVVLNIVY